MFLAAYAGQRRTPQFPVRVALAPFLLRFKIKDQIGFPRLQQMEQVFMGHHMQLRVQVRNLLRKLPQMVCKGRELRKGAASDRQRFDRPPVFLLKTQLRLLCGREDRFGVRQERAPLWRHLHDARRTLEQLYVQLFLQVFDLVGNSRLRDLHLLGGTGKAQRVRNRQKTFQLKKIHHGLPISFF